MSHPNSTGEDDHVAEVLFFYSLLGDELGLELSDLPPEPQVICAFVSQALSSVM